MTGLWLVYQGGVERQALFSVGPIGTAAAALPLKKPPVTQYYSLDYPPLHSHYHPLLSDYPHLQSHYHPLLLDYPHLHSHYPPPLSHLHYYPHFHCHHPQLLHPPWERA